MRAHVTFKSTLDHIIYAVSVFRDMRERLIAEYATNKQTWAEGKAKKGWFHKDQAWYLSSLESGSIESYCTLLELRPAGWRWSEEKLAKAEQLLAKYNCAIDDCDATQLILSDTDLELLSISLDSALESMNGN